MRQELTGRLGYWATGTGRLPAVRSARILLLFFVTLAVTAAPLDAVPGRAVDGTWTPQESGTTSTLYHIHFVDSARGWAVGKDGTILHTEDGGASWTPQASGTTETLYGVHFADGSNGWAVGASGTIVRTADGGATWAAQPSNTDRHLHDVYFMDSSGGWAVGGDMDVIGWCDPVDCHWFVTAWCNITLKTTDGGATWTSQSDLGRKGPLFDVYFVNEQEGWAVGGNKTILHTTDGGVSWSSVASPVTSNFTGVAFGDLNRGWITGRELFGGGDAILRTVNQGACWTSQDSTGIDWEGIHAVDADTAWIVGQAGSIRATNDGGETWMTENSGTEERLYGVFFLDRQRGWTVGGGGTILRYELSTVPTPTPSDTPTSTTTPMSTSKPSVTPTAYYLYMPITIRD